MIVRPFSDPNIISNNCAASARAFELRYIPISRAILEYGEWKSQKEGKGVISSVHHNHAVFRQREKLADDQFVADLYVRSCDEVFQNDKLINAG